MSEFETQTRESRRSALDDFAQAAAASAPATVPMAVYAPPMEVQHGALAVAVKRDEATIFTKLKALAAAAGEAWYYRWPVQNKKKGTTEWVEGPSIKMANDLARIYGNNDTDVRVQDFGDSWLFHARFIDLESGAAMTRPFQQRKTGGTMGDDAERKRDIAFQIGASKAIRNVVTNFLQTYADFAMEEAKSALVDKIGKDIERWRRITVERVQARVELARVEAVTGRAAKDWLAPDIARIIAMMTAVADGMATLDETFPPLKRPDDQRTVDLDSFASAPMGSNASDGAEAGAAPSPPENPGAAPVLDPKQREDVIQQVLLAARNGAEADDRLANLDGISLIVKDSLAGVASPDFIKQLLATGAKVAKGELDQEAARKYLRALPA